MAEGVGFEPTVSEAHTAFRERHHQPLGHPSGGHYSTQPYQHAYLPGERTPAAGLL